MPVNMGDLYTTVVVVVGLENGVDIEGCVKRLESAAGGSGDEAAGEGNTVRTKTIETMMWHKRVFCILSICDKECRYIDGGGIP